MRRDHGNYGRFVGEHLTGIAARFRDRVGRVAVSEAGSDVLVSLSGRPPVVTRCHLFATLRANANTHGMQAAMWRLVEEDLLSDYIKECA